MKSFSELRTRVITADVVPAQTWAAVSPTQEPSLAHRAREAPRGWTRPTRSYSA